MGQSINVSAPKVIGKVAMFDTDRTFSGQDGESYQTVADTQSRASFPAALAAELFALDASLSNVYVYSNLVSIERPAGWDSSQLEQMATAIRDFFVIYEDNKGVVVGD